LTEKTLALYGGRPLRKQFLPFHRPLIGEEEIAEVIATLRSGWLTTGPRTKAFEEKFCGYIGCSHAVALNSCTAGLHLALETSGTKPGDEVITSPVSFASTANVIVHCGGTPVFVDVEPGTLNMNPDLVEKQISSRTKAIVPVHFAGHPCEMDRILGIAENHGLTVIEDAAHALEAEHGGRKIGTLSPFTAFSFYATKNITTGEGGMLAVADKEMEDLVRILSLHGISRDAWKRYSDAGYRHWEICHAGYKYNMFDLQAAVGIHQMDRIEAWWETRRRYVTLYNQVFQDLSEIEILKLKPGVKHAYHLYPILLKLDRLNADRDVIMNAVQAEQVGIGIHFRAIHLHPFYRKRYGFSPGMLPVAEDASRRELSLPLYPGMTEDDLRDVIAVIRKVLGVFRKTKSFAVGSAPSADNSPIPLPA
jgi:dTDP-4-amino-4,6-dideoxygalactose transaminase